jgi:hypothetical protein
MNSTKERMRLKRILWNDSFGLEVHVSGDVWVTDDNETEVGPLTVLTPHNYELSRHHTEMLSDELVELYERARSEAFGNAVGHLADALGFLSECHHPAARRVRALYEELLAECPDESPAADTEAV